MKKTIQFTATLNCTMTSDFSELELEILNDEDSDSCDIEDLILGHSPDIQESDLSEVKFDGFKGK